MPVEPSRRRLRIYSYDPALATRHDFAGIAELTIDVPWEGLSHGPIGEYVEVIDIDPASQCVYAPVNLNDPHLIATDGLAPSEGNPQFHQQMCYAVAMSTIRHFERALGRLALWSDRTERDANNKLQDRFVRRLRIYPHALRDQNAFYSGDKKAILFGYFPVERRDGAIAPGTIVFTCLSHDIIAHEVTHALLDGVHPRFSEPMNRDVLAFHEAFADIVALFQHFTYPGVLRDQIARTGGNLQKESLLGQLAQQFGEASGRGGALRNYLGERDKKTNEWKAAQPDARLIEETNEPHDRGAILVAAVFGAFAKVYRARTRDLYRIASEGTGVLREGEIHPDLIGRLADEAARCADYLLQMCIRAIDYCPPVGITFGDYLRGLVTADFDMEPEDRFGFRIAFIESFREWGIYPPNLLSISAESLLWPTEEEAIGAMVLVDRAEATSDPWLERVDARGFKQNRMPGSGTGLPGSSPSGTGFTSKQLVEETERIYSGSQSSLRNTFENWRRASDGMSLDLLTWLGLSDNRGEIWELSDKLRFRFREWLESENLQQLAPVLGLVITPDSARNTIFRSPSNPGQLAVEIHAVRTALRRDRRGRQSPDLVVEITQRRRGYFDPQLQREMDMAPDPDDSDFIYRAGCTLLMNPVKMEIRRVIRTPGTVASDVELARMRDYLTKGGLSPSNAFAGPLKVLKAREPFALLHRHGDD